MLSAIMLSVIMLSVIMLSVVAPPGASRLLKPCSHRHLNQPHQIILVSSYNLYDIHEKFEYSCDVTNKVHPHPLMACLLCLKGPTFLY
jgi:hypothetical protein